MKRLILLVIGCIIFFVGLNFFFISTNNNNLNIYLILLAFFFVFERSMFKIYLELEKEKVNRELRSKGGTRLFRKKQYCLDTNVIIDGRIFEFFRLGIFDGKIIIPNFIGEEIHLLSETNDIIKKSRAQRGLKNIKDVLDDNRLNLEIIRVDKKKRIDLELIDICKDNSLILVSNDKALIDLAKTYSLQVIYFEDIIRSITSNIKIGDIIKVDLIKKGKDKNQAIGYSETGQMVVVNNGENKIGQTIKVKVLNIVNTSSGCLIFSKEFMEV